MRVTLYVRESGTRKYRKANHRTIYPAGTIFVLRYAGRWETLNAQNFTEATVAAKRKEADLIQHGVQRKTEVKLKSKPQSDLRLADEVRTYLDNVSKLSKKTHAAYRLSLNLFQASCKKVYVNQVTKQDFQAFDTFLIAHGNDDRTRANRCQHVTTFLLNREGRRAGPPIKDVSIKIRYTEQEPEPYTQAELTDLMQRSSEEDRVLWRFLLGTGFREAEASVAEYQDINLETKTIRVIEKPEFDFRPKDHEKRLVPIPDSLIAELQARRNGCSLIFHKNGKVDGHLLRRLKRYNPSFILHRFRKSFATDRHAQGAPANTIRKWLGHSDLQTTLRYLAGLDDQSEQVRNICNATHEKVFAAGISQ